MFDLNFDPAVIFWTLVSFGIVYYVVSAKVYPVLRAMLNARADKIAKDLESAQAKFQEAETQNGHIEERLQNMYTEEMRIVSEAQEKAKQQAEVKAREYQAEFELMRQAKEKDLQKIELNLYKDFEEKAGKVLVDACEKVLRCDLPKDLQSRIIDERIKELKSLKEF